jgi:uncharacterized protein YodC (DUF2158 family)
MFGLGQGMESASQQDLSAKAARMKAEADAMRMAYNNSEIGQYKAAAHLAVGSVVRLKSGSPDITVTGLAQDASGDRVTGIWYAKQSGVGKFEQVSLPRSAIELVKP